MQATEFRFKDNSGVDVHVHKWMPDDAPRAVIQVVHGMQEPAYRYAAFAADMTAAGYAVYAADARGHGQTLIDGLRGKLGDGGWESVLAATTFLTGMIRQENPDLKVFLLGHSWGSFLSQAYMQSFGDRVDGVVLSGTNGANPLVGIGLLIARMVVAVKGGDTKAVLLHQLSLGPYNNGLHDTDTGLDWLSRDTKVVRDYFDDPECGADFPNSFYFEMLRLLKTIWTPVHEKRIPKDLPIYIFAGAADPVGGHGKGVKALYGRYVKYGIQDVTMRLFAGGRHEMLNEINRDEVIAELKAWLEAHI